MILKDQLGFQICWWRTIVPDTYLHIPVIYQGERGAITGLCKIGQRMRELKKPLSNSCSQSYLKKHFQRSLVLPIPKLFFFFSFLGFCVIMALVSIFLSLLNQRWANYDLRANLVCQLRIVFVFLKDCWRRRVEGDGRGEGGST